MTQTLNKSTLMGILKDGAQSYPVVGSVVWWNCFNVEITQDNLAIALEESGINKNYSKEHSYKSAFIRALNSLKEQRIIRLVKESATQMIYQFTAETKINENGETRLDYERETTIIIDKRIYGETLDIQRAITQGRDDIKAKIIELFEIEKVKYKSSDMTRLIQKILNSEADLVSLRDNGGVYFIPQSFVDIQDKVANLISKIPGMSFEFAPLINHPGSRNMVGNAVKDELLEQIIKLTAEVQVEIGSNIEMKETWTTSRLNKIRIIAKRIDDYAEVLENKADPLKKNLQTLEQSLRCNRFIDLD